jgi:hypothetical protein
MQHVSAYIPHLEASSSEVACIFNHMPLLQVSQCHMITIIPSIYVKYVDNSVYIE